MCMDGAIAHDCHDYLEEMGVANPDTVPLNNKNVDYSFDIRVPFRLTAATRVR